MAAQINLKVNSDFKQASKDLEKFGNLSEAQAAKIQKFQESFKTERIDSFLDRNRRAGAGVKATAGEMAALETQQKSLNREMQRLIKNGLDPQDDSVQRLRAEYDKLDKEVMKNIDSQKGMEMATKAATASLVAIGVAVGTVAVKTTLLAADAEELENKYSVVFDGITEDTQKWIDTYSEATARGSLETKEYLTTLQDMQTGFGATTQDAAMFSKVVAGVTSDLVSFSNVPVAEAQAAITSGLSGQFRALQSLGIGLNVAIINQGKYAESINKTWLEMSNLEKREAILTGIIEQSGNAVGQNVDRWQDYDFALGDAAKTSASFSNQQKETPGLIQDIGSAIGTVFLPAATEMITWFNDSLASIRDFVRDGEQLKKTMEIIGISLAGVTAGLVTFLLITKGSTAIAALATAFRALNAAMLANPVAAIATVVVTILIPAIILLVKNWDLVVITMSKTIAKLSENFKLLANNIKTGLIVAFNSVKIAVIDLALIIANKLFAKIKELLELAGKIPFIGHWFDELKDTVDSVTEGFEELSAEAKANSETIISNVKAENEAYKLASAEKIKTIEEESAARLAALDEQKKENEKAILEEQNQTEENEEEKTKIMEKALAERLESLENVEAQAQLDNIATFKQFLEKRMDQEMVIEEERIAFLAKERRRLLELEELTDKERVAAAKATQELIAKEIEEVTEKTAEEVAEEWKNNVDNIVGIFESSFSVIGSIAEGEAGEAFEAIGSTLSKIGEATGNAYIAIAGTIVTVFGSLVEFIRDVQNISEEVADQIEGINTELQDVLLDQEKARIDRLWEAEQQYLDEKDARREEAAEKELEWLDRIAAKELEKHEKKLEEFDAEEAARRDLFNSELQQITDLEKAEIASFVKSLSIQEQEALRAAGVIEETTLQRIARELKAAIAAGDEEKISLLENEREIEEIREDADRERERVEAQEERRAQQAADERIRLIEEQAEATRRAEEKRLDLLEDFEEARIEADEERDRAEREYRRQVSEYEYQRALYERDLRAANAEASKQAALADLPWYTSRSERNEVASAYDTLIDAIESTYVPRPPAFANGGSFMTAGPQNITVGDNIGGIERVTVEPVSSSGANVNNRLDGLGNRPIIIQIGQGQFEGWLEDQFRNQNILVDSGALTDVG